MPDYRIEIDLLLCQGHGVCAEECPEVFAVEDMGTGYPKVKVSKAMPGAVLREKVEAAVTYCPNRTIRLVEIP
jgi:ferredoxin